MTKKVFHKRSRILNFLTCLVIVYSVAIIGGLFTNDGSRSEWYLNIKPSITPPNYVFPIVWNILFLLITIALYNAWIKTSNNHDRLRLTALFSVNFLLNVMWSLFYFGLHQPLIALADIALLVFSTIIIIINYWKTDKVVSYLLLPYLIWLLFAAVLNLLSV